MFIPLFKSEGIFVYFCFNQTLIEMEFTKRLVETFMQQSNSSTSGYQDEADINRNLAAIDNELMETFAPLYSVNGKVQDLLQNHVKVLQDHPVVNGVAPKPDDYVQYIDSFFKGNPVYTRNINEVSIINTSPIRKPTLDKGPYFVYFSSGNMNYLPKEIDAVELYFIKRLPPGEIKFEVMSTDDSDYVELSVVNEIQWPERAFNLFLYHLMERYGVEMKEQLSMEYSQLGITREVSKV